MNTTDTIAKYKALGWTFNQSSWMANGKLNVAYRYCSPRMRGAALINDGFDEERLLIDESEFMASQDYGTALFNSLKPLNQDIIKQIGTLYRLRDRGKPVEVPQEIVVKDVVIKLIKS